MLKIRHFHAENSKNILPYVTCFLQSRSIKTHTDGAGATNPKENVADDITERRASDLKKRFTKRPARPPFLKNLFCGNFDPEICRFPQIVEKERFEKLDQLLHSLKNTIEGVDSEIVDGEARIPDKTMKRLKDLGIFGLQIPEEYGGLGLRDMEYASTLEAVAFDSSINPAFLAHQLYAVPALLVAGTEDQKRRYLPKLASGEWTAALCALESDHASPIDLANTIRTTAERTEDGKHYRLSGCKSFNSAHEIPDLMTVLVNTTFHNRPTVESGSQHTLLLLVEKDDTITMECRRAPDSRTTEIYFHDTIVPIENAMGKVGDGNKLLIDILNSRKFALGNYCAGDLKGLLKKTVDHTVKCKQFGNLLSEFSIVKERLARVVFDIYVMESMAYLTAGMMDTYKDQDCMLESAAIKIFSLEKSVEHVSSCLQLLGGSTLLKGEPYHRILHASAICQLHDGTNDMTRLYIGLTGINYAVQESQRERESRSVLSIPFRYLTQMKDELLNREKEPKLGWGIHEILHPSLAESVLQFEFCTKKFANASKNFEKEMEFEDILTPPKQWKVRRMADVAIDLFAMTAVLTRASRAYCIGIHNADQEMRIAQHFVSEAVARIDYNLERVLIDSGSPDRVLERCSTWMIHKNYKPVHPLGSAH